jgi:hypothetical protein
MIQRKQAKQERSESTLSPSKLGRNSNFRTELSSIKERASDTKSYNRIGKQANKIGEK